MHLKSLTLKGFKSFADRSVMTLEPGITAIVGPNGSGKSNISDSVLWVLGERNAKNLRGQAMEDVIFAGSSARKSVGLAEVELVLDNSDATLSVDFDEVSLMRRVYRSGESEYYINGAPARRMDFMDILHDTGLGSGAHSIISQGKLDAVLASKPEDRRALIEEAAGILKHKQRKDRSARKLSSMDVSLARVQDVAAEIERQLKPLARKAQRAQQYQGLADELARLDLMLAVDDLRSLQAKWDAAIKSEHEAAAGIDVQKIKVQQTEETLEKLQLALQEKGLYVGDLTAQRGRFHMVVERFDSTDRLLSEKARSIRQRREQAESTSLGSARRISNFKDEIAQLQDKLDAFTARRNALSEQVEELKTSLEATKSERQKHDERVADAQKSLRQREREIDEKTSRRAQLQDALSGRLSSKQLLESKRDEVALDLESASAELDEKCKGLDEEAAALAELLERSRAATEDAHAAERSVTLAHSVVNDKRKSLQHLEGKIAALEEINRGMLSKNSASAWIAEHGAEYDPKISPLAAEVRAPQDLEALVEQLLDEDIASMYVHDCSAAAKLAQALANSKESGTASVLVAGASSSREATNGPRLIDSLEFPEHLRGAMECLLGDVRIVESTEEGIAARNEHETHRFATKDGIIIWPNAKITVHNGSSDEEGMLARERKLDELRQQHAIAQTALDQAESEHKRLQAELERKRAMSLELSRTHAQRAGEQASAQAERERLAKRVGSLQASQKSIADDLSRITAELEKTQPEVDALASDIEQLRASRTDAEERMAESSAARAVAYEQEQQLSAQLSEAKLEFATAKERSLSLTREHRERTRDLERAEHAKRRAERELLTLEVAANRIEPLHELLVALKESANAWVSDLAGKAALEQSNSVELNESINEARAASRAANEALEATKAKLNEVRVEKGKLEIQVEAAVSTIVDECGTPLESALEIPAPEDRAAAEGEAFKMRRKLNSMGTIDSSATDEYEAMKERYDFMASQIEDMQAARRSLKRIISAIDERMKRQFETTFERVNSNFQDIFGQLFPGGSASLSLVGSEDDPNELGVEVHAQPRGKKIAKMTLMSGGEKSLTAIALLFAVYRIRRAPFYILDEVEAALDDSNLRRLIAYLSTLRNETQLIMITHQRRTMEMSDVLYGVSMQADGVTKVISQRLKDALPHAE